MECSGNLTFGSMHPPLYNHPHAVTPVHPPLCTHQHAPTLLYMHIASEQWMHIKLMKYRVQFCVLKIVNYLYLLAFCLLVILIVILLLTSKTCFFLKIRKQNDTILMTLNLHTVVEGVWYAIASIQTVTTRDSGCITSMYMTYMFVTIFIT